MTRLTTLIALVALSGLLGSTACMSLGKELAQGAVGTVCRQSMLYCSYCRLIASLFGEHLGEVILSRAMIGVER